MPVREALSPSYRDFLKEAEKGACEVKFGEVGEAYLLDDNVRLEIIREGQPKSEGIADNRVMVTRVEWQGWKVLVASDLGFDDELSLLESGVDLTADIILMGRHDWGISGQRQFLDATGARVIVFSSSQYLPHERPKPEWVKMVKEAGYELFNQAETGAVLMDFNEDKLRVRSYLNPEMEVILQR